MRSSLLLLLLVGAVMSVRAQVSLSGQVRSAPPTAQPLAGVVIEAGRAKATTDEQGRYTLTLRRAKPSDLIRLQPERAGYALLTPTHQFVVIPPHGQQKRNLVMGVEANYSSLARNWHQATFEATLSQHYQDSLDQVPEGDARADLAQRFAAAQLAVNRMDDMFLSSDWQQTAEPFFAAFAAFPEQPGVVLRRLQEQQLAQQTQRALAGKRRKRQSPSPEALAQALRLRARAQVLSLQLTDAAESFRTALALDDRNALDLWESARFFQAIDQPEEAVRLYRLAMDRTRTPAWKPGCCLTWLKPSRCRATRLRLSWPKNRPLTNTSGSSKPTQPASEAGLCIPWAAWLTNAIARATTPVHVAPSTGPIAFGKAWAQRCNPR